MLLIRRRSVLSRMKHLNVRFKMLVDVVFQLTTLERFEFHFNSQFRPGATNSIKITLTNVERAVPITVGLLKIRPPNYTHLIIFLTAFLLYVYWCNISPMKCYIDVVVSLSTLLRPMCISCRWSSTIRLRYCSM